MPQVVLLVTLTYVQHLDNRVHQPVNFTGSHIVTEVLVSIQTA